MPKTVGSGNEEVSSFEKAGTFSGEMASRNF